MRIVRSEKELFWNIFKEICYSHSRKIQNILTILFIYSTIIGFCPLDPLLKFALGISPFVVIFTVVLIIMLVFSWRENKLFRTTSLIQKNWKIIIFWDLPGNNICRDKIKIFNNGSEFIKERPTRIYFEESLFPKKFDLFFKLTNPRTDEILHSERFSFSNGKFSNDKINIGIDECEGQTFKFFKVKLPIQLPQKEEREYINTFTGNSLRLDVEDIYDIIIAYPTIAIEFMLIAPDNYEFIKDASVLEVYGDEDCTSRIESEEKRLKCTVDESVFQVKIRFPKIGYLYRIKFATQEIIKKE